MAKKILWVDNDPGYIRPFKIALEGEGYSVTVASTVFQAEACVDGQSYDLIILDVMIPTVSEVEEDAYRPEDTENSLKTGLLFYRRKGKELEQRGTPVLVMTVRIDKAIRREFIAAGLPENHFATKMELRESPHFVSKIKALLSNS
jgi:CheY-like chemotaxis protein